MSTVSPDGMAQGQLKAFIERIERLEEEKAAIAGDIKEVYAEAKGNGFDTKVLRKIISLRKVDHHERMEQEALLEIYMIALGMIAEPEPDDDAETGEIIEPQAAMPAQAGGTETLADQSTAPGTDRGDNSTDGGLPAEPIDPAAATTLPAGTQAPPVDTQSLSSAAPSRQTEDRSVEAALHGSAPVTNSQPVTDRLLPAVTVVAGRESATDPSALPAVRLDHSKPHPDCQDPSDCGLASWTHMCGGCMRARAATAAGAALQ